MFSVIFLVDGINNLFYTFVKTFFFIELTLSQKLFEI